VFYHGSVDVPLLVRWPGRAPAGAVSDAFVQQTDIYPTVLDVVGEKAPDRVAGKSLVPLFSDTNYPFRETAYSEVATRLCGKAIMAQNSRWKYVMDESGEGVYLFDEEQDRGEQRNLVGHTGFRHVEADMRDRILRFLARQQTVL
jgi:arylsulfatase A-like enzyme